MQARAIITTLRYPLTLAPIVRCGTLGSSMSSKTRSSPRGPFSCMSSISPCDSSCSACASASCSAAAATRPRVARSHMRVPKIITANAKSGESKTSQEYSYNAMGSPLHQIYFANIDRVAFAINRDNHCQRDRRFCCCDGDNKDSEDLPCQVGRPGLNRVVERKADHRYIDGVKHDFDAHQYSDGIAFSQGAIETDAEEYSAEYQEMV